MSVRCHVEPLPHREVAFFADGTERLRWRPADETSPRPYFYPLIGPSGRPLTRMGHPGAPNHDHHRSIWFGHEKVLGINFWGDATPARIRQKSWSCYEADDVSARMATVLEWLDGHDPRPLLTQELIAVVRPLPDQETAVEIQTTFQPVAAELELGQSAFGVFAVRLARELSTYFGGGTLTNDRNQQGEPALFGQRSRWIDASGPILGDAWEGLTYFDHPANPGYPAAWHVRADGWIGASLTRNAPMNLRRDQPLTLRYALHAHRGKYNAERADAMARAFAAGPLRRVIKGPQPHVAFAIAE